MTRRLIAALAIEIVILGALVTVAADQIAHTHVEKLGGVNVWGYRGPVLHQKKGNEVRIVVTGGDLAFGWGVAASEALAPSVRDPVRLRVDRPGHPERIVTGVTTGARGLPPTLYAAWIDRYAYLRPDVICLVLDPIGHVLADGTFLPDRRSLAFRRFGYSPILPLVLEEKGVMTHSALRRLAGGVLDGVDRVMAEPVDAPGTVVSGRDYAASIDGAVRAALRASTAGVVLVLPPAKDNAAMKDRLSATIGLERVRLVDLGADPRMLDPALRLDGFSFSVAGHAVAAQNIAPWVLDLLEKAGLQGA